MTGYIVEAVMLAFVFGGICGALLALQVGSGPKFKGDLKPVPQRIHKDRR
jgi:hypothetical protein